MPERLLALREDRRLGRVRALAAVCSSHPLVLRAALEEARVQEGPLLVEAAGELAGPLGGTPRRTPAEFALLVHTLAREAGFPPQRILLGADGLGPAPWRHLEAERAMARACTLVEACVDAGFRKLHLDAGASCQGDPDPLPEYQAALRTAALCRAAEGAFARSGRGAPPVYVVGSERPSEDGFARITTPEEWDRTLDLQADAWRQEGLAEAWGRVVAAVAQPGIGFTDAAVDGYDPRRVAGLDKAIARRFPWTAEARSTDYQRPEALGALVRDGFGILKVGPWLTFACREALFALEDLVGDLRQSDPEIPAIRLREVLDQAIRRDPVPWKRPPTPRERSLGRLFSFSDRSRHHWTDPEVAAEVERLLDATHTRLPRQLLGLHLPLALDAVLDGRLAPEGAAIVRHEIRRVLESYRAACAVISGSPRSAPTPAR